MKTFEIGKTYTARSACNHDCIFSIKVIKRTAQTVTFEQDGKARRAKIHTDNNGEWIMPDCVYPFSVRIFLIISPVVIENTPVSMRIYTLFYAIYKNLSNYLRIKNTLKR